MQDVYCKVWNDPVIHSWLKWEISLLYNTKAACKRWKRFTSIVCLKNIVINLVINLNNPCYIWMHCPCINKRQVCEKIRCGIWSIWSSIFYSKGQDTRGYLISNAVVKIESPYFCNKDCLLIFNSQTLTIENVRVDKHG